MTDTYSITYQPFLGGPLYLLNGYDVDHGLTIHYLGDQGFGLAPLHRITTRGPLQHGDSDIDFRLDPRILQIPLLVKNESASPKFNSYAIRQTLLSIFRPQDTGRIDVIRSNGTTTVQRTIYARVLGGLTFDVDPQDYHVRTVVQLRADDPTWFEPFVNVFTYTNAMIGTNQTVNTTGNWPTFPLIILRGPITNPKITNVTTGQFIEFSATLASSVTYIIDLEYGKKTVIEPATSTNRINQVTASSNLATWSLVPGNNSILVTGTGTSSITELIFTYNHRYTGI
jgi:hypothetical protein